MKKLKITQTELYDGTIIYTIYFKSHTKEQEIVEKYLESINSIDIGITYLENGKAYIDYYKEKKK